MLIMIKHTVVHGQAAKEWQNVLDRLLRCDLLQKRGKGVGNKHPVEGGFTARKKINLFEGAETLVVER